MDRVEVSLEQWQQSPITRTASSSWPTNARIEAKTFVDTLGPYELVEKPSD